MMIDGWRVWQIIWNQRPSYKSLRWGLNFRNHRLAWFERRDFLEFTCWHANSCLARTILDYTFVFTKWRFVIKQRLQITMAVVSTFFILFLVTLVKHRTVHACAIRDCYSWLWLSTIIMYIRISRYDASRQYRTWTIKAYDSWVAFQNLLLRVE